MGLVGEGFETARKVNDMIERLMAGTIDLNKDCEAKPTYQTTKKKMRTGAK